MVVGDPKPAPLASLLVAGLQGLLVLNWGCKFSTAFKELREQFSHQDSLLARA